jgi:hypothetical protein
MPPAPPPADPIPRDVCDGPRVELPDREYFLYRGPVESAVVWDPEYADDRRTANLWWPEDRSWCVACEIDLPWSYVAGSPDLVGELVAETDIEVVGIDAEAPVAEIAPWVAAWVSDAADQLLESGEAVITTPLGSVQAWLEHPRRGREGSLTTRTESVLGMQGGGLTPLRTHREHDLRQTVEFQLHTALLSLAD